MLPVSGSALKTPPDVCSETGIQVAKKGLNHLPSELAYSVVSALTPFELAGYSRVNRNACQIAQCALKNKPYLESLPAWLGSIGIRNKLTVQAVLKKNLTIPVLFNEIKNLREQVARALYSPAFSDLAKMALSNSAISALILESILALDEVMTLTTFQIHMLQSDAVRACLFAGLISINDVFELSAKELFILEQPSVKKYLLSGLLDFEFVHNLNYHGVVRLNCPVVQKYIDGGFLNVVQAATLTNLQYVNLNNWAVQSCIATGLIPFHDLLDLTATQRSKLEYHFFKALNCNGIVQ